jgi:MoxR-like ATPase
MSDKTIASPEELQAAAGPIGKLLEQLDRILLGHAELHRLVVVGLLSRGHILLEGVPGVGKTELVKSLAQILRLSFKRVQFTPDLMPSDILGSHILQETPAGPREMTFHPGPIFTNLLLADEINRASPKTQSALLEAMQERSVTLLGSTHRLEEPFFVLASQNPIELEGTYPLPEAQLDRFLFKLIVHNVDVETLDRIISERRRGEPPSATWHAGAADLGLIFDVMERIHLPKAVSRYISRLVASTHPSGTEAPEDIRKYVAYGASPRAAIAIAEAARGWAVLAGRPSVGFDDVKAVAPHVLNHRLILNHNARFDQVRPHSVITNLMAAIEETGLRLPDDLQIVERTRG